jgi:5'-3' exonuclease
MSKILLIDATGLMVRCDRAARGKDEHEREFPAFLFARSVTRYLRLHQPTHVLAAWDGLHARDWRRNLYPMYKAGRPSPPSQDTALASLAFSFFDAAHIAQIQHDDFEGDDVIAWAVWKAPAVGIITIRSDDADLYQLLRSGVCQYPLSGDGPAVDLNSIVEEYKMLPPQLPLMRALAGDKSDGIPGLRGVGPVNARKLLERAHWNLGAVHHHTLVNNVYIRNMVRTSASILDLSVRREHLDCRLTENGFKPFQLADWEWRRSDAREDTADFFRHHQMQSLSDALDASRLW